MELRHACDADEVVLLDVATLLPLFVSTEHIEHSAHGGGTLCAPRLRDRHRHEKVGNILKYFSLSLSRFAGRSDTRAVNVELCNSQFMFVLRQFTEWSLIMVITSPMSRLRTVTWDNSDHRGRNHISLASPEDCSLQLG